jgi:multidrug efflux system outer membrane protein
VSTKLSPGLQLLTLLLLTPLVACTVVGPDFTRPEPVKHPDWVQSLDEGLQPSPVDSTAWWRFFNDPVLDKLVAAVLRGNNDLEIAALRVLEAKAALAIATGQQYPQAQFATGSATLVSPPRDNLVSKDRWQYGLGASMAWELDFWGRFQRGIEAADANYLASTATYHQAAVLLTASVVDLYTALRTLEEQLRIAHENVALQQRSFRITQVNFSNGADSELDVQQARTQLLSTEASIPALEASIAQTRNALSALLGSAPGSVDALLTSDRGIPEVPNNLAIGIPADLLRRRPDVRAAEYLAAAQSAVVGVAEAALYPSFSLNGAVSLSAGGLGDSHFGDLFDSDAIGGTAGVSMLWPFLNYGRIKNAVRVQDARLQQALLNFVETTVVAAREVEDAMAALIGARRQVKILTETVAAARRAHEISTLRYAEGYANFERVLRSQQALFAQQQRLVNGRGDVARAMVALYRALGGGWEGSLVSPALDEATAEALRARTDWGDLIQ